MKGRFNNLTGKKFNRLTVIERVRKENDKRTYWRCRCDCGNETIVRADQLTSGSTKSCRCLNDEMAAALGGSNFIDLSGKRFGRLLVINYIGDYKWLCKCDCGKEKIVTGNCLCSGMTRSCGCLRVENTTKIKTTHGLSKTRLYSIWGSIVQRCTNSNDPNYRNYGGRGIKICKEWRDNFESFYDWSLQHGYKCGLSIDRINNDGNYQPENCRWANQTVQNNNTRRNRRFIYGGKSYTIAELDRLLSDGTGFLSQRLYKGWTLEEALSIPKGGYRI